MSIKNINDYNPSDYACYAVTSIKQPFTLNTVHPTGLQEYPNYDTYDLGEYTLIAFKTINLYKTDFVYRIVSQDRTEDIQSENYEFLYEVLEGTYDKNKHTFYIMQSVPDYSSAAEGSHVPVDPARRCDLDTFAAMGFHDITVADGKPYFFDTSYATNDNIVGWVIFLSSMSNIYILKAEFNHIDESAYKEWAACTLMGETFTYVLKMAYEWSLTNKEPWNNAENVSVRCAKAIEEWNIPEDVMQEIIECQPDTSLGLYLKGDPDPRKSTAENRVIPPKFKNWFISRLRYRTLGSLDKNYPLDLNIPQEMINKEKSFFEKEIYHFCIKNGLNPETVKSIDLLQIEYFSGKTDIEKNNQIVDIVKKNPYVEDDEIKSINEYMKNLNKPHDFNSQLKK